MARWLFVTHKNRNQWAKYLLWLRDLRNYWNYLRLNGKYLEEAEARLAKKNHAQTSEKFWGACAGAVKAVAAKRGKRLGSHRSLGEFVAVLDRERPGWELLRLFNAANSLHANFYEDWLPPEAVDDGAEAVREMVQRLRGLL